MSEDIQATPFNFAMIYYVNLNNRIVTKDDAYMQNDVYGYFKGLDRIYNLMYFKIEEKESDKKHIEELDKLFEDCRVSLQQRKQKKEIMTKLHQIDKKLMVLMHKYKMIFPNIESVYGMEKIATRYKLHKGDDDGTN